MTMSNSSKLLRGLAASTALALSFSAMAAHPLSPTNPANLAGNNPSQNPVLIYHNNMLKTVPEVIADKNEATMATVSFMHTLETEYLNKTLDKPSLFAVPNKASSPSVFVLVGLVPPTSLQHMPITVCAQHEGKPLRAWEIMTTTANGKTIGQVIPRPVVPNPEGTNRPACNATMVDANRLLKEEAARIAQANTPPVQTSSAEPQATQTLDGLLASLANNGSIAKQAAPRTP